MSPQRFLDVLYLVLVSALWVALGSGSLPSAAATLLAVPLCLIVPGYLASLAALPRGRLLPAERTMYTLALSISIVILCGLLLDVTTGITTAGWAVTIAASTVVAALIAIARNPPIVAMPLHMRSGVGTGSIATLAVAVLVTGGAVAVAGVGAKRDERRTAFAQVSLIPPHESQAAPKVLLRNVSQRAQGYLIRVTGAGPPLRWHVTLEPHGRWTSPALPLVTARRAPAASVSVYRVGGGSGVYRQLSYPPGNASSLSVQTAP